MRVLQLVKTSNGAYWAWRQIRELVKLGIEVHVAIPDDGVMRPKYEAAGARVHIVQTDFPVRKPTQIPGVVRRFRALVRSVNPSLIHSHFVGTTLTMRLALRDESSIPRVFQVPGPLHLEHAFFRTAEIATAKAADYWIGSCRWTTQRYRRSGVASDRIFLNYYGLAPDLLASQHPGKLREELGLDKDVPLVGMVAFMYPPKRYLGHARGLKGHEDLIDAVASLATEFPTLRCVMVGGAYRGATAYENALRAYAAAKCGDRVIFLGTRNDVSDLYRDFDVAVHPSLSENLGGAGESAMIGIPTVATDVGGFPDIIIDGETGWLVPPRAPSDLSKAIRHALLDREEAIRRGLAAKSLAYRLLDIEQNARELRDIYHHIVRRHRA